MAFQASDVLKHRVVYLLGEEPYLIRRALDSILVALGMQRDDFDLQTVGGDSVHPREWIASAGTSPFLAERRTVIVRNAYKVDPDSVDSIALKALPASSLVILVGDEPAQDSARRKLGKKKSLDELVKSAGGLVHKFASDPNATKELIRGELAEHAKKISSGAVETLIEMTGGSTGRAMEELEKLILFSSSDQISEHDVRSVVVPSREWNIWQMLDSIVDGEVSGALKHLSTVMTAKQRVEETALSTILPLLGGQLRLLWQARVCIELGLDPARDADRLATYLPDSNPITKVHAFRQSSAMKKARGLSLDQLTRCFRILNEADAMLKGAKPAFSGLDTVEQMILKMGQVFAKKKTEARVLSSSY